MILYFQKKPQIFICGFSFSLFIHAIYILCDAYCVLHTARYFSFLHEVTHRLCFDADHFYGIDCFLHQGIDLFI